MLQETFLWILWFSISVLSIGKYPNVSLIEKKKTKVFLDPYSFRNTIVYWYQFHTHAENWYQKAFNIKLA